MSEREFLCYQMGCMKHGIISTRCQIMSWMNANNEPPFCLKGHSLNLYSRRSFSIYIAICMCRSQGPCGLRHELSSLARTLGSWVRIPLKAWMRLFYVCVVICVGRGLAKS
jgi:hypothetical protein